MRVYIPAGLEEELGVRIVSGFADDAEGHFHDVIEFAQQALMQVGVIAPGHKGHFLAQVDLVVLECRDREPYLRLRFARETLSRARSTSWRWLYLQMLHILTSW